MKLLDAINTRRSIRSFTGEKLTEDQVKTIIKAGFQAPSAHNSEPRDFIIIKDKKKINEIIGFHPYAKMLAEAGFAIVVCGDKKKQKEEGFLIQDCAASTQNILLASHALGLGAVWCGLYPKEELVNPMAKLLNLPEHIIPVSMVVVGNKEKDAKVFDRYNEKSVRLNKW